MANNFGEKWAYCSVKFGALIVGEFEEQFFCQMLCTGKSAPNVALKLFSQNAAHVCN